MVRYIGFIEPFVPRVDKSIIDLSTETIQAIYRYLQEFAMYTEKEMTFPSSFTFLHSKLAPPSH